MGKKSEKSKSKRIELKNLADLIILKSREKFSDCDSDSEYNNYVDISNLLENIIQIQSELKPKYKTSRSDDAIRRFTDWCVKEGAKFPKIEFKKFSDDIGFGMVTKDALTKNEIFIEIPDSMIFSFSKIQNQLPEVIRQKVFIGCPLFENMSNVRLALAFIIERINTSSKFKPYFDVLPEKFRTVLYFSPADMKELKGSTAFSPAMKQVKFIASQYAFLYKYLMVLTGDNTSQSPELEELKENFTYDFFRYAVSIVMTRQNIVEIDGIKESVLIPAWDMANHSNGIINTQYNDESKQIESFCLENFKIGEQVTIAYGFRSNLDFLIHNGFVFQENENKDFFIKLSLSKFDKLFDDRKKLLEMVGLSSSGNFQISPTLSNELIAYIRIFNMNIEQILTWQNKDSNSVKDLLKHDLEMDSTFKKKVFQFLLIRIKILLKVGTSLEEDSNLLLNAGNISKTKYMLIQYRMIEKKILSEVAFSLEERIKLLD